MQWQEIDLGFEQKLVIVEAVVNGQPARLLLDTGATTTVLKEALCGGTYDDEEVRTALGDGSESTGRMTGADMEVRGVFRAPLWDVLAVPRLPHEDELHGAGAEVVGILGNDLLRNKKLVLDFASRELRAS